jgi:hypothetical protein
LGDGLAMRNLLGRLNARPPDDLARIASFWGVQLAGSGAPGSRHRQVGQLYRALTDPRAVRDVWERLATPERALVRLLALARSETGDESALTVAELAAGLDRSEDEAHTLAAGLYRVGILAREGDDAPLPVGVAPRLFLPRELAQLFRRVQDEIEAGDLSATPLRALLELLDDAELEEAATVWGLKVIPGLRRREDLSRQVLTQLAAGRVEAVVAKRRADARRIWDRVRAEPAGQPVPLGEAARAAGLEPEEPRTARRLREALAELETALLVWHTYRPDGSRWLFVPAEVRAPRATPAAGAPLPEPHPADAVEAPGLAVARRQPAALAWDLLTLLREATAPGGPRPDEHGGAPALPRPWLRRLNRRLWWAGEDVPPPGYVPFLLALGEAEGLLRRAEAPAQGAFEATPALRGWRDRSFPDQLDRLRERWLAAPEWIEGRERERERVVVWGADWRGFRRRLLALIEELEPDAWYPADGIAAWAAGRDPDLLGPTFTAATARRAGEPNDDPAERRRAAVAEVAAVALETAPVWFGVVEVADAGQGTRRVRVVRRPSPAATDEREAAERAREAPLTVSPEGEIRLRRPNPVRVWSLSAFADLERLDRESVFRLSADGMARALAAGFDLDQVTGFLARQSGEALPPELVGRLRGWARGYSRVRLRRSVLVTPDDAAIVPALHDAIVAAGLPVRLEGDGAMLVEVAHGAAGDEAEAALAALLRSHGHAPLWVEPAVVKGRTGDRGPAASNGA